MTNPANRIADLLNNWRNSADDQPYSDRLLLEGGKLLGEIESFIETSISSGKDLFYMREAIPVWANTIRKVALNDPNPGDLQNMLFALRALALAMDNDRPPMNRDDAQELSNLADELESIIQDDKSLPVQLRRYCFEVLFAVRRDLEEWSQVHTFDLQISIDRLIAATNYVAAAYADDPTYLEKIREYWARLLKLNKVTTDALQLGNTASKVMDNLPSITG